MHYQTFVSSSYRSGSMDDNNRMERLQQSAIRWLKYDVKNGTKIGITSFSDSASQDKALTKLTESNRQDFVDKIGSLKPNRGTCLGKGLMKGMDVSNTMSQKHNHLIFHFVNFLALGAGGGAIFNIIQKFQS